MSNATLPGSAKYVSRRPVAIRQCCVNACAYPVHAGYQTTVGACFCLTHWRRYLIVELAERFYPECLYSLSKSLKYSMLQAWLDLATHGSPATIKQTMRAFQDEMEVYGIGEVML